ncbi:MAG: hypothetical protein BWY06_03227 [Candidatus Latescibacteria bacterium ADurb.Bin168]|nr:MAG: hypothetical protein BWY06_03227 [Candidatus Latescibacteria bacterium ADurb.Bin168]
MRCRRRRLSARTRSPSPGRNRRPCMSCRRRRLSAQTRNPSPGRNCPPCMRCRRRRLSARTRSLSPGHRNRPSMRCRHRKACRPACSRTPSPGRNCPPCMPRRHRSTPACAHSLQADRTHPSCTHYRRRSLSACARNPWPGRNCRPYTGRCRHSLHHLDIRPRLPLRVQQLPAPSTEGRSSPHRSDTTRHSAIDRLPVWHRPLGCCPVASHSDRRWLRSIPGASPYFHPPDGG